MTIITDRSAVTLVRDAARRALTNPDREDDQLERGFAAEILADRRLSYLNAAPWNDFHGGDAA